MSDLDELLESLGNTYIGTSAWKQAHGNLLAHSQVFATSEFGLPDTLKKVSITLDEKPVVLVHKDTYNVYRGEGRREKMNVDLRAWGFTELPKVKLPAPPDQMKGSEFFCT